VNAETIESTKAILSKKTENGDIAHKKDETSAAFLELNINFYLKKNFSFSL